MAEEQNVSINVCTH